jgi:hypothetical protein
MLNLSAACSSGELESEKVGDASGVFVEACASITTLSFLFVNVLGVLVDAWASVSTLSFLI